MTISKVGRDSLKVTSEVHVGTTGNLPLKAVHSCMRAGQRSDHRCCCTRSVHLTAPGVVSYCTELMPMQALGEQGVATILAQPRKALERTAALSKGDLTLCHFPKTQSGDRHGYRILMLGQVY